MSLRAATCIALVSGCMVGGMDTYPLVPGRTHDYYQSTWNRSEAVAVDQYGGFWKPVRTHSGGEGWGWAIGIPTGLAEGDVHGVHASGLAVAARAQITKLVTPRLGFALSALYDHQELDLDGDVATLAYGGYGLETRVMYSPVDLFVFEAGVAGHRGSLDWTPKGGMTESGSVLGGDVVLGAGYTVNYVGVANLLGLEARFTRTGSTMLGGMNTAVATSALLGKVEMSF